VDNERRLEEKLDAIIELLEDLFILQATKAKIGREHIRAVLKVRPARISNITKGLKRG
jgi:hypothetical protein